MIVPEIKYNEIELKDVLTIFVSTAILLTAVSTALFNRKTSKIQQRTADRQAASEALLSLSDTNEKLQELRFEQGPKKYFGYQLRDRRAELVDRREFFLSQILLLSGSRHVKLTHTEYLLLASTLMRTGRTKMAAKFYKKGYNLTRDKLDKAVHKRVYGRSLLAQGYFDRGRKLMLDAAKDFKALLNDRDYDRNRVRLEVADTYRRIVRTIYDYNLPVDFDQIDEDLDNYNVALYAIKIKLQREIEEQEYQRLLAIAVMSRALSEAEHADNLADSAEEGIDYPSHTRETTVTDAV